MLFCLASVMVSCGGSGGNNAETVVSKDTIDGAVIDTDTGTEISVDNYIIADTHEQESDYQWDVADEVVVHFDGAAITVDGEGAIADGGSLIISHSGTYRMDGVLDSGGVIVESDEDGVVRIVLDNVSIFNPESAAINIVNADKTIVYLEENSSNTLSDADSYVYPSEDDDEPNAVLFSKDDLSIAGSGALTVNANYNDGITSKDGLVIAGGEIAVTAVDDAIRGKDYLYISGGDFVIDAAGDGLKSDNDDEGQGYIIIDDGIFSIRSEADAVQASSNVQIANGNFDIVTGSGYNQALAEDVTAKGIKAGVNIFIEGGNFLLNTADDAVHSNNGIQITDGIFDIETGDDGIHADTALTIIDGSITVSTSYEGIESAVINLSGGNLDVSATDDGINIAGGVDSSGIPGMHNPYQASQNSNYFLDITGGYIHVNAQGDGIDANGNITLSGGFVIVNGPTGNMNGALDYDGSFIISGGTLLAVGSSGMAQAPSVSSSQHWVGVRFPDLEAKTLLHLQDSNSSSVFTFRPAKRYASVVYSSPDLDSNESYALYSGGSSSGTDKDGLYQDGVYSSGTLMYTFTPQ